MHESVALDRFPRPHAVALAGSALAHGVALLLLHPWGSALPSLDDQLVAVDLSIERLTMDEPTTPDLPPQAPTEEAIAIPTKIRRPRPRPEPEAPGPDAGPSADAGPDASPEEDAAPAAVAGISDAGPADAAVAAEATDAGARVAAVDAGPNLRGRSEGLTASLPAFVRVAVVVQAERLRDSPHAGASRRVLRRAMGLPDDADPIADLEELVVVTADPYDRRSTTVAARASREARERPDAGTPTGFAEGDGDAGILRRGRTPPPPEKLPPGAGLWRQRLIALAHPPEGDRPVVAVLAQDLRAFSDPEKMGPAPDRIDLQAWDLPDGGARAVAVAHYGSDATTTEALRFWNDRLRWARTSPWVALLGLRPLTERVTLVREGRSLRAEVHAERVDVRAALTLLETAFQRGRPRPSPEAPSTAAPPVVPPSPP